MAKVTIKIDMGNAAFDDGMGGAFELARILAAYAQRCEACGIRERALLDVNGNTVGAVTVTGRRG
jgi:hypothetical protein